MRKTKSQVMVCIFTLVYHGLSVCSYHTHKYMFWYDFTTFIKFHMLFAMHFIFKIVEAPVSMYKVLIEEIMYILYSALNKQTVG